MNKNKNSLLWEIKSEFAEPSYLFGTMHVQDEKAFRNIDLIEDCILKCTSFAAEYDLDSGNNFDFEAVSALPDGQKLSDFIKPLIYEKLNKIFKRETGLKLQYFEGKRPIIIMNMLSSAQFAKDKHVSLDEHLYDFAKGEHKEMLGIESFDAQLDILKNMPMKAQLKSLKDMALNFGRYRRSLKRSAELYMEADLSKLTKKAKSSAAGMRKLLLYDRNILMADKIAEIISEKSLFAAIGAGHLGGKKGVLYLLKKKGFGVRAV
jgi:uncharacterized protein YbaP (TraB family)